MRSLLRALKRDKCTRCRYKKSIFSVRLGTYEYCGHPLKEPRPVSGIKSCPYFSSVKESKPVIICVVGSSGSGKTTAVREASQRLGIPFVCSYTTRPMREGEVNGIDHHFVDVTDMPTREDMIAYTYFGGYHYWATKEQVDNEVTLYVIDEVGLVELQSRFDKVYNIIPIYIRRDNACVDARRLARDEERTQLPIDAYRANICNNSTLDAFLDAFCKTIEDIVAKFL